MPCECQDVNLEYWETGSAFDWGGPCFYRVFTPLLFRIPFRIKSSIEKAKNDIKTKGYRIVSPFKVILKDGWFFGSVFIEIEKPEMPDPNVVGLGKGGYFSKLVTVPWKDLGKATRQFLKDHSIRPVTLYFWYLSCLNCSEEKGFKTVIIAKRLDEWD